jgi:hypothetical protein
MLALGIKSAGGRKGDEAERKLKYNAYNDKPISLSF